MLLDGHASINVEGTTSWGLYIFASGRDPNNSLEYRREGRTDVQPGLISARLSCRIWTSSNCCRLPYSFQSLKTSSLVIIHQLYVEGAKKPRCRGWMWNEPWRTSLTYLRSAEKYWTRCGYQKKQYPALRVCTARLLWPLSKQRTLFALKGPQNSDWGEFIHRPLSNQSPTFSVIHASATTDPSLLFQQISCPVFWWSPQVPFSDILC